MMCRILILILVYMGPLCRAAEKKEAAWALGEKSRAVLNGDSSVRKWRIVTETVHGSLQIPYRSKQIADFLRWVHAHPEEAQSRIDKELKNHPLRIQAVLKIKVEELKSGNSRMENDMQEALKAEKHPWIIFTLSEIKKVSIQALPEGGDTVIILHTSGLLQLAGVKKTVNLDFELTEATEQSVLLVSNSEFLMTSFDINPPKALFGLIKAHDNVDIHYEIELVEVAEATE